MKALLIALAVAVVVTMAGCSDGDADVTLSSNGNGNNGNNGGDGGGNVDNLQTFVVNNCGAVTDGDAFNISGQMFPPDSSTDPVQSVYTGNCLGNQD